MTETSAPALKNESDLPEIDPLERRQSRIKLLLIFSLFAVPLLMASIYLHFVRTSGGHIGDTSRGQLIQPAVPLKAFSLEQKQNDEVFNLDAVRGIWTLLYAPEGECADTCQLNLYHMRQVRLALNHRMDRVQRAIVAGPGTALSDDLLAEHLGLIVATGSDAARSEFLDQVISAESAMKPLPDAIYLIDPLGNLMLRFPPDLEPKSMLKDIKHLLKVSRIG